MNLISPLLCRKNISVFRIYLLIIVVFSIKLGAQVSNNVQENIHHLEYYLDIREKVKKKEFVNAKEIDFRRLRYGGMLYMIAKSNHDLPVVVADFLSKEKQELNTYLLAKDTSAAVSIAKVIIQEDIVNLFALNLLSLSKIINEAERKQYRDLFLGVSSSIMQSANGKSIDSAYEVFSTDESDFLKSGKCKGTVWYECIKKNGRSYSHVSCGEGIKSDFEIYFDFSSSNVMRFAPRGTSFEAEFIKQEEFTKKRLDSMSIRTEVIKTDLKKETRNIADSMVNGFIKLYKERKWDELWEHFKEKSPYFNLHEASEKEAFFSKIRGIYDTCGAFESAEFSEFHQFHFGSSLTNGLEYQYKADYERSQRTIFLEIWTINDSVMNFRSFGLSRSKDD